MGPGLLIHQRKSEHNMTEKSYSRFRCILTTTFIYVVLVGLVGVVSYALGMLTCEMSPGRITIVIHTTRIGEASDKAIEKTGEAMEETGKKLQKKKSESAQSE